MMDPQSNTFRMLDSIDDKLDREIPFAIGEEITIKGHIFKVAHVDIPRDPRQPHLLVLQPFKPQPPREVIKPTADMIDPPLA